MYFIVYSIDDEKYFVVPRSWIHNLEFEAIVNDVINSSLQYDCYRGLDAAAWNNKVPDIDFIPTFGKGTEYFQVNLVRYNGKFGFIYTANSSIAFHGV